VFRLLHTHFVHCPIHRNQIYENIRIWNCEGLGIIRRISGEYSSQAATSLVPTLDHTERANVLFGSERKFKNSGL